MRRLPPEVKAAIAIIIAFICTLSLLIGLSQIKLNNVPSRYQNGHACLSFCNRNGLVVREWKPGNYCSCMSPNSINDTGQ